MSALIRYNALSSRLSKLEQDDFNKFMREGDDEPNSKPKKIIVDHEAQMQTAKRI